MPRKKEDGRPKGTYKRFKFEETRIGFLLKYEVPVVYGIIMNMTPASAFPEPSYLLIKTVCKGSSDPSLKKGKFFRYLEEYAKQGLYCKRPKVLTPQRKVYYEAIRKKKMERFIERNRERVERLRITISGTDTAFPLSE